MVCRVRVPQTRKHVCDRISHGHELAFGLSRRGFQVPIPLLDPRRGGCGAVDLRRSKSYGRQGAQPS
ncbi:30S ribosomal protein S8 [Streptomyces sp. SID13726]|nr:30S ribosomal protein S8 [Streptomyces sp. SID13726]